MQDLGSKIINLIIAKNREEYILFKDGKAADRSTDANGVLPMLHAGVLLSVYDTLGHYIGVHSASVVKNDRCILIPAKSGRGKSTLTAALVQSGFRFSSDDLVFLLSKPGQALPVPSPVGIKQGAWSVLTEQGYPMDDYPVHRRGDGKFVKYIFPEKNRVHGFDLHGPAHVHCIAYPEYTPEIFFDFRRIEPSESLCLLAEAGFSLPETFGKKDVLRLMGWIKTIPAYRLCYNGFNEAVTALDSLC